MSVVLRPEKKMLSSCIFISIVVDGRHREGMNK